MSSKTRLEQRASFVAGRPAANFSPLFLVGLTLLAAGCTADLPPETQSAPRTQEVITIGITAEAAPAGAGVQACSEVLEAAVVLEETGIRSVEVADFDLVITLGMVSENPDSVAPIAEEEIILMVPAKEEPVPVLSTETLQAIFAGQARSWSEVQDGAFGSGPISLWNYPAGHPLRDVIEAALLESSTEVAPIALLAPGPRQMVEALSGGEGGVGFLPSAWLAPGLQKLELEPEVQQKLRLPVLISSRHEFAGELHSIVSCLQVGLGHEALMDIYPSGG